MIRSTRPIATEERTTITTRVPLLTIEVPSYPDFSSQRIGRIYRRATKLGDGYYTLSAQQASDKLEGVITLEQFRSDPVDIFGVPLLSIVSMFCSYLSNDLYNDLKELEADLPQVLMELAL